MKTETVTMVRVYCSDRDDVHREIIDLLHRDHRVAGVTAFRGIAGFGQSGRLHEAGLLDLSLDRPIVIEFFARPERVEGIVHLLNDKLGPGHVVCWPATANLE